MAEGAVWSIEQHFFSKLHCALFLVDLICLSFTLSGRQQHTDHNKEAKNTRSCARGLGNLPVCAASDVCEIGKERSGFVLPIERCSESTNHQSSPSPVLRIRNPTTYP